MASDVQEVLTGLHGKGHLVAAQATASFCGGALAMCTSRSLVPPAAKEHNACDACALVARELDGAAARALDAEGTLPDAATFATRAVGRVCKELWLRHAQPLGGAAEEARDAFVDAQCIALVEEHGDALADAMQGEPRLARLDWTCVGVAHACTQQWFFEEAQRDMRQKTAADHAKEAAAAAEL